MGPATTLTELGAARFVAAVDKMLTVYTAAMNPAPSQLAGRRSIMARHATNPGFRALAVLDDTGEPVAFSYGFPRRARPVVARHGQLRGRGHVGHGRGHPVAD